MKKLYSLLFMALIFAGIDISAKSCHKTHHHHCSSGYRGGYFGYGGYWGNAWGAPPVVYSPYYSWGYPNYWYYY